MQSGAFVATYSFVHVPAFYWCTPSLTISAARSSGWPVKPPSTGMLGSTFVLTRDADDSRPFGSEAPLDLRMGCQQKQRPGEGAGGGFMARQQQRQGLIAELRARHPLRTPFVDGP